MPETRKPPQEEILRQVRERNCEKKVGYLHLGADRADLRKYVLRLTKFTQTVNKI